MVSAGAFELGQFILYHAYEGAQQFRPSVGWTRRSVGTAKLATTVGVTTCAAGAARLVMGDLLTGQFRGRLLVKDGICRRYYHDTSEHRYFRGGQPVVF